MDRYERWTWDYEESLTSYYHVFDMDDFAITLEAPRSKELDAFVDGLVRRHNGDDEDDLEFTPKTIGLHLRYIKSDTLTDEAKSKLLDGLMKKGIDWVDFTDDMPPDFIAVTLT